MTYAEYASLPGINWSRLKLMAKSPLHFKEEVIGDSDPMSFGRAAHCTVLEPLEFPRLYVLWDGGTKRGKAWDKFCEANAGKYPLSERDYNRAVAVRDAVLNHPVAGPYFTGPGESEVTLQWTDAGTGLNCKARLDRSLPGTVVDLKTAADAGPDAFARAAARYQYAHQMAHYCMGANYAYGAEHRAVIVAVESEAPHDVCVYELSEDDLWTAGEEVKALLRRVKECMASGQWPGRFTEPQTLDLPPYAFARDDSELELTGLKMKETA